jgi:hypothetical protein
MKDFDFNEVFNNFNVYGKFIQATPYGSGHINDTFAITCDQGGNEVKYILQRINHNIFTNPEMLMDNIVRVTEHIKKKVVESNGNPTLETLTVIRSKDDKPYYIDSNNNYWRMYIFIESCLTYDIITAPNQAYEAARAFGEFQKQLSDMEGEPLFETIPNFHNTIERYNTLLKAIEEDKFDRVKLAKTEIDYALKCQEMASKLINLNKEGKIPTRVTHNDTKLNNVMLDKVSTKGICVIDLDTVMPGLTLYDFGDMIRTATRDTDEDEQDLSKVKVIIPLFEAVLSGYLSSAKEFLNKYEIENLIFSGKLISLEIGVRFLTDFLQGDTYFKTKRENHNLDRCKVQFKMVESINENEEEMNKILNSLL